MVTEITVEVLENIEKAKRMIEEKGFRCTEIFEIDDLYYSRLSLEELMKLNYAELIKNSFLIRKLITKDEVFATLIYKDKIVDDNEIVIGETKIKSSVADVDSLKEIFKLTNLTCWCELHQHMSIFDNSKTSFMLQEVENLGNFIEYEEDLSLHEIDTYKKIEILKERIKELGILLGDDFSCKKTYLKFKNDMGL